jgi:acetate kinase
MALERVTTVPAKDAMTDAHSGTIILALNSGSSSLKFGLYRVSASRTEALLSGEAQSIGEGRGRFHVQDSQANSLRSETVSIPAQRDAIVRIGHGDG